MPLSSLLLSLVIPATGAGGQYPLLLGTLGGEEGQADGWLLARPGYPDPPILQSLRPGPGTLGRKVSVPSWQVLWPPQSQSRSRRQSWNRRQSWSPRLQAGQRLTVLSS